MGDGQQKYDEGKPKIKEYFKKAAIKKLFSPSTWMVLAIFLVIIIICGTMVDVNAGATSNTSGMTSVSSTVTSNLRAPEDSIDYLVLVDYNNSNDNIPSNITYINEEVIEEKFNRRKRSGLVSC